MIDYSEALLNAKKYLKQVEDALMHQEHHKAFDGIVDAEAEMMKLKNWIWRNMRNG